MVIPTIVLILLLYLYYKIEHIWCDNNQKYPRAKIHLINPRAMVIFGLEWKKDRNK